MNNSENNEINGIMNKRDPIIPLPPPNVTFLFEKRFLLKEW